MFQEWLRFRSLYVFVISDIVLFFNLVLFVLVWIFSYVFFGLYLVRDILVLIKFIMFGFMYVFDCFDCVGLSFKFIFDL